MTADGTWTYQELQDKARDIAAGIAHLGLPMSSKIGIIMANYPEFVAVKLAIAQTGCVAVPINYQLQIEELSYILDQAGCSALFAMAEFRGRDYRRDLIELTSRHPSLHCVAVRTEGPAELPAGLLALSDFARSGDAAAHVEVGRRMRQIGPDTLCDIVYTSGTTGRPKGAMLTHDMLLRSAFASALTRNFEDGRRIAFALPMYHVFGYVECWIAALFVGGAIIPQTVFNADAMIELAERFAATDCICVPIMTHALMDAVKARGGHTAPLRSFFNSGGVNQPTVWDDIRAILKPDEVHTAYGMTETTASTMCTRGSDGPERMLHTNGQYKLAGPAGDPTIGGKIALYRVVDPVSGAIVPAGDNGELQVKGPVVTTGYYLKPDETQAAFTDDGWFRTGDVGRVSADGFLTLTGRIKEVYRCGGEMVMPREIEALVESMPGIAQALVVGVPDDRMGEVGCLCIVDGSDGGPPDDEIFALCRAKLARFKVPKYILRVAAAEIPLTATGRPQKFALAMLATERLGLG